MAAKKSMSVEDKLRALYDLQVIHSRIDQIRVIRGELPLEVEDLEDELAGLETRVTKLDNEVQSLKNDISSKENKMKESAALIKKYEEQQNMVRNNREFDALTKEIEFQSLEIQLCEKRIKEFRATIDGKAIILGGTSERFEERKKDLELKKGELDEIISETRREEELLNAEADVAEKSIEERLLIAYNRIRTASKNGLAVVPIDREASAGSFIKIPPQKQLDVAARKKIMVDEHSGRILVDKVLAEEEVEKINKKLAKVLKA